MITIRVIWSSSGRPVRGAKVSVFFSGLLRGSGGPLYTNDDGDGHFDVDPGSGEVFVDGKSCYEGYLRGRVVVYV